MVDQGAGHGGVPHQMSRLPDLLWPPDASRRGANVSPQAASDLDIEPVVQALSGGKAHRTRFVTQVLAEPPIDAAIIAYRADVVTNLLEEPQLRRRLEALLPLLGRVIQERQR